VTEPTPAAETPAADDDPNIPGEEVVYRRLAYDDDSAWVVRDQITGERVKPASGAFNPDPDGVSVFRRSVLAEQDRPLGPANLVVDPRNSVVGFTVEDLRSIWLGVRDDPWPTDVSDPKNPIYAAHALIKGLNELGRNQLKKRRKALSELPSMTFVHVPS
jgi:hypothetical protein